jgi:hypothetical protein
MKHLKFAWLLVVLLALAACGKVTAPETNVSPDTEVEPLDALSTDALGATQTEINLGTINPGQGTVRHDLFIYVRCTSTTHANSGSMRFWIVKQQENSEVTGDASLSIPNAWPNDGNACNRNNPQVQSGNFRVSVTVPAGAASGDRRVDFTVSSQDTDVPNNITITVRYTVAAPAPSDTTPPTVNISFPENDGQNDWFISKPVVGTVSANDPSNVADIICSGATVSNKTDLGTNSASATLTVSAEGIHNVTCTAKDGANNSGAASGSSNTGTVKIDTIAPTVNPANVNNTDWRKTSLSQEFTASDSGSGLANSGDASFTLTASAESTKDSDGNIVPTVASRIVSDQAGNATTRSVSARIDKTNPTITASAKTEDGQDYTSGTWTNQNVTVRFTCSDALSGIAQGACPDPVTVSSNTAVSGQSISDSVSDRAGNSATSNAVVVKVDKTKPTITANAGSYDGNWTNQNVTVSFECGDALSGIADNACPANVTVNSDTNASGRAISGSVSDRAGNSETSNTVTVKVDKSAPTVSVTGVSNGATYTLGSVPTAGCSTTDGLSGVATDATPSTIGGPVGSVTATCSGAKDNAGNTNSASVIYTVQYDFGGWLAPLNALPTRNTVKAGRAVPVKFSLGGDQGLNIFSGTGPGTGSLSCTAVATDPVEETLTAGSSSLSYDASTGLYTYVWKTETGWANTCRSFRLNLRDGSTHQISFQFTK